MSDKSVQLVNPEDNSERQFPLTLANLVATNNNSNVETELGNKKPKQTAVSDPAASGTAVEFISNLTQDANGVVSPSKKTVRTMGASGTNHAGGLVPDPGPTGGTTKYLCENGQWSEPGGGGGGGTSTPTDVQINGTSITNNNVANIQTQSNYDATNNKIATMDDLPSVPSAATNSPNMDGTAAVGSSSKYAKEDHVHPTDTTRASSTHTHGNVQNGGTLNDTPAAPAGDDYMVIRDGSDNKIQTSNVKGTAVKDAVDKKHSHSDVTLSTTAQNYDGSHTIKLPSNDPYSSARPPQSHTHGNITNGGKLQTTDVAPASGDKLVIVDNSSEGDGKIARSSITFGSDTTKFLRNDGAWDTPSGGGTSGVSDVKIVWGSGSSQASTVVSNVSSIYVHGTYSPTNNQKVATLKTPTGTQLSGAYITKYNSTSGNIELCTSYSDLYIRVGSYAGSTLNWHNVGLLDFGGIIVQSGISLTYDNINHTVNLSASGGGSYSAGTGINISSNTISVKEASVANANPGGLLVTCDADPNTGYSNQDTVVAVPIFYGTVGTLTTVSKGTSKDTEGEKMHYVNVKSIIDAIDSDENLKDALKQALGLK